MEHIKPNVWDRNRLKYGNSKLFRQMVFDLPAIRTCPNSGLCKDTCYATKAERVFPACLPWREGNLILFRTGKIEELLIEQYDRMRTQYATRLHSSGDLFCTDYVQVLERVSSRFSDRLFYAFTKVWDGYGKLSRAVQDLNNLPNVNIIDSLLGGRGLNYGDPEYIRNLMERDPRLYLCPSDGEKVRCGIECRYCIEGGKYPVFIQH